MKKGRRAKHFELEWITISYRTIGRWAGALGALVLVVGAVYLAFRLEARGERKDVERIIELAERQLKTARSAPEAPIHSDRIASAEARLGGAREKLARNDVVGARADAEEARETLRGLSQAARDRATLHHVEGDVDVKWVGSLDWTRARRAMEVGPGDLLRTGPGSAVQFVNLDGSTVTLGENSVLRIERSTKDRVSGTTDVAVSVNSGQLTMSTTEQLPPGSTAEVQAGRRVRARLRSNTVLGVGVEEGGDRARLDVFEGQAQVQAGAETVDVAGHERVQVSAAGMERRRLLESPRLLSPAPYRLILIQELEAKPIEFEWESTREARAYRVEIASTPLFTSLARREDEHATNYLGVADLPVGRYYWRVTALDGEGVPGSPSAANMFRISDVRPQGDPPPLALTRVQPLGEGMFLIEGTTSPGVFVTIDDGSRIIAFQPTRAGSFRQVVSLTREGVQLVTITARSSEGLESQVRQALEVRFQ